MEKLFSDKEYERMTDEYDKVKYLCSCGHRVIIPKWVDKQLCNWCGHYVFKSKGDEFKFRMKEKLKYGNIESNLRTSKNKKEI